MEETRITTKEIQKTQELIDFIKKSPSCYHVIHNIAAELEEAGYEQLNEAKEWTLYKGGRYFVTRNQSSLIAFTLPEDTMGGFLICASHSDSPTFKLKSNYEMTVDDRYLKLNVEKYGGMICSTWLDRPLSIAGRVVVNRKDGIESVLVNLDQDLCLIPNLAIHMNRQINEGYAYNAQKDMLPLLGEGTTQGRLKELLAKEAGVEEEALLGYDLFLYLREEGKIWGVEQEFYSSPRIDDLQCAFASKEAFLQAENTGMSKVLAIFDNEEVGSGTKQGAKSTFLSDVLARIQEGLSLTKGESIRQIASSMMLSADNGHALHPNHTDKADPTNAPRLNGGVLIKYNANQKYTTDGIAEALFKKLLQKEEIPYQEYTNRSDIAGGSTLGNLSNEKISLNTVDMGAAQLAMHSAYETGGTKDTLSLVDGIRIFYESRIQMEEDGRYRCY